MLDMRNPTIKAITLSDERGRWHSAMVGGGLLVLGLDVGDDLCSRRDLGVSHGEQLSICSRFWMRSRDAENLVVDVITDAVAGNNGEASLGVWKRVVVFVGRVVGVIGGVLIFLYLGEFFSYSILVRNFSVIFALSNFSPT